MEMGCVDGPSISVPDGAQATILIRALTKNNSSALGDIHFQVLSITSASTRNMFVIDAGCWSQRQVFSIQQQQHFPSQIYTSTGQLISSMQT
jgi:hypothetical protein